jgi:hypothetical protein
MSTTIEVGSLAELERRFAKDMKGLERKVRGAVRRAANKGRRIVKGNVPVAHGELRESVHSDDGKIIVDAPHAAAVNNGSRPHWMPIGPLLTWVKLRGMQGLATDRQRGRLPGTTTAGAAQSVAGMLASHERGGSSSVDAPMQVARAIQHAIATRGTRPHHFIETSLPALRALLDAELHAALHGPPDSGGGADEPAGIGGSSAGVKTYYEGAKGGVFSYGKNGGKNYVNRYAAARIRDEHHVHAYKPGRR